MESYRNMIRYVVNSVACVKHRVDAGEPCYIIPKISKRGAFYSGLNYSFGVCNSRAVQAGMNSKIDPRSLRAKS